MVHKDKTAMGALFFSLLLFLSGCSQTDLALRYADQFLAWELKDQFGFKGEQKQKIDELSKKTIRQLKSEFLPELIDFLSFVKVEFLKLDWSTQSTDDGYRFLNENRLKFKYLGQKSLKILAQNAPEFANLTLAKNWQVFAENFKDKNKEIKESKAKSRFPDLLDRFLGDLTKEQEIILNSNPEAFKPDSSLRIKNREKIMEQFNKSLTPFTQEAFSRLLNDFFTHPEKWNDSSAIIAQEIRHEEQIKILAQILKVMTNKQKKNLIEEWDDLIQDLKNGAQ